MRDYQVIMKSEIKLIGNQRVKESRKKVLLSWIKYNWYYQSINQSIVSVLKSTQLNDRTNKQMKATNEIEAKSVWFGWEFKIHSKLIDWLID